jgi:hypothetical protein
MSQLRQGLLPLDDLDDQQFEGFLLQFLGAGISLEVIEEVTAPASDGAPAAASSRAIRHRLVNVSKYGPSGRAGQRGIDLRAMTESGLEWVFQCKHYPRGFTAGQAREAVEKAETEYPGASRYFLVISGDATPPVDDVVKFLPKWELWGRSTLSVKFFNEVSRAKQIEILRRVFPAGAEAVIARLFPQHDDLLIDTADFFERWLKPTRLFHHRADLVGREKPLQALHDFADDPDAQALILPAPGGVGKTRLLRAFGEAFPQQHPGRKLWFIDPYARPGVGSDHLRAASSGELVVVQDDAHRAEALRADVVGSVIEKDGKLVFATRPHGVDALIGWLTHAGLDHARIRVLPPLAALSREERVKLAASCLPTDKQAFAEPLADIAKACTLIITVGAQLITEKDLHPSAYLESRDFQAEVFDRLEKESFAQITTADGEAALRDTLRLLAVLAPWSERVLTLGAAGALIHLTPRAVHDYIEKLQLAGLLVETREGWRVVPDLFADHLVYRACYDAGGGLTPFARRLQTLLLGQANGTVLRNLAEAEWQAQLKGQSVESLLAPFWREVMDTFAKENFWERSRLIVEWRRFAVYQPERSLQLTRLAIDLDQAAPPPEEHRGWDSASSLYTHERVLGELPALLEPIAVYHAQHREWALDLLWELHLKRGRIDENAKNEPLAVIGGVAKFKHRHPADAPLAVVRWLAERLRGPQASAFCDHPSSALAVMLKPIFEREVENNYSSGNTLYFQTYPLSAPKTRTIRGEALDLLRDQVIPRGEVAVLNALAVLDAAIDMTRRRRGGEVTEELEASWMPDRLAALQLIERLIEPGQSPRVLFRIVRMLRPLGYRESYAPFKAECQRVMALVPDTPELRLVRVLVSNAWDEFFHDSPLEDESVTDSDPKVASLWDTFSDEVAAWFLGDKPMPEAVVNAAEVLSDDYRRVGFSPQFSDLFSASTRQNPELAADCIDVLLARESSSVDYWWTSWFFTQRKLPDARLQAWIMQVLRGGNPMRWRALQGCLRWVGIGEVGPEVLAEVAAWASRLDDTNVAEVFPHLRWHVNRDRTIDETILTSLNLSALSERNLNQLAACLKRGRDSQEKPLPAEFVIRFIEELHRFDSLGAHESRGFWRYLATTYPVRFYDVLKRRISETNERRAAGQKFDPLPLSEEGNLLSVLPEVQGYAALADDLFQRWRTADAEMRFWWRRLFQDAVLRVSPLGLGYLRCWLNEATQGDEFDEIIGALKFSGSMTIFAEPAFVVEVLRKIRSVAPARFDELSYSLRDSAAPSMRGYTNHQLDPEYRYYREAAIKAAEIHVRDPELAFFYREIIRTEDADAARQRKWVELETSDWE